MELIHTQLTPRNAVRPELAAVTVRATADTGAAFLCIPPHVAMQLQADELEKREVTLADGSPKLVSHAGPVRIQYADRSCFVGALVMGDEVLLGAIPMEDMDLVLHPLMQSVSVNPKNPNFAASVAKGVGAARDSEDIRS